MKFAFNTKFAAAMLAFLLVAAVLSVNCFAQTETGQISGTVRDSSGALVAGAKVMIKSANTGITREAVTNSVGIYTFPGIKPDTYEVTVDATGFQKWVRKIVVSVGGEADGSAQLVVGTTATTIEVQGIGEAVAVNTESQTLQQVVTAQQINALPTDQDRNPYALVGTAANVQQDTNSGRGAGYAINGQRSASTSILLDGAENVDTFTAGVGQAIPLDSVQEFSVMTNNYSAEFGRASGGVVNLVTKSGTNQFHGSAYEFNRVSALSSNTYNNDAFDITKGVFTRNNFGFSVGGPVIKNKLFFFDNLEWIRVRSAAPTFDTIIDPGSYSQLAAASQAFFTQYGTLASGLTPLGAAFPCGVGTLNCDTVSFTVPSDAGGGAPENTWDEIGKVDYNISDKTLFSFRYAGYHEIDFPGYVNSSPYAGYSTGQSDFAQNYTASLNHVFAPTLVNEVKVIYNRLNGPVQPLGSNPVGPTLYTASSLPSVGGFPLVFPGYSETTPGNSIPFGGPQNLYQVFDDVSWTHGKHQFKFGGQFIQIRDNRIFGAYENAVENLGTNLSTGLGNLITGNIHQFQGAVYPQGEFPCVKDTSGNPIVTPACTLTLPVGPPDFERNYHYNDSAFYGQDTWKITPRLTLNGGLRWEYYGVQHNANQALDSNFVMGSGNTIFNRIQNGSVKLASQGGVFWKPYHGGFGPHIGFAWDIFGDTKMSLRGGYSIGYERNFGNVTFNAIQNPPAYAVVSLVAGSDLPSMPVYTDNAGPLAGTGTKALPAVSQRAINQNMKPGYAETYDLSIERQLSRSSLVSISYAGSHGVHLYDISNVNPSFGDSLFLGNATPNRLNYQYSNMNFRSDGGYSHYNSMSVQYRATNLMNKGVSLNTAYTWSHSLDPLSSTFTETNGGASGLYYLGYLDAFNPNLDYGNSDFDIRQRFIVNGSWELPWMKSGGNPVTRAVLGGWGMGANFVAHSGAPFSIFDCDNANDTGCPQYAATGLARTGSATPAGPNFEPNTFNYMTLPNTGGIPNNIGISQGFPICSGLLHVGCVYTSDGSPYPERNNFFGPGFWNIDANFFKNFKLTERFQLQFRAEMYNIFNHHNQYISGLDLDTSFLSPDVNGNPNPFIQTEKGGQYGYAGNPGDERRNIQLGLRLSF